MSIPPIRWPRAIGGALLAEVAQVVATFAWVAFFSYVIRPGLPVAAYQAHAQVAGPWVSIIAGVPIFYAASRWIARDLPSAMALFACFVLVDGGILVASAGSGAPLAMGFVAASYVSKLAACALGGRAGTAPRA